MTQEGGNYDDGLRWQEGRPITFRLFTAEREATQRLVAQWNKEQSRRHFALSLTQSVLSGARRKARLQELVGDDLVVADSVFKTISSVLSSMRVERFGARQIKAAGRRAEETVVVQEVGCEEGKTWAASFVQTFVKLRNEHYTYIDLFGSVLKRGLVRRFHRRCWTQSTRI